MSGTLAMLFRRFRINPLGIASGAFMLVAPFGSWMTLTAFGFVSGSNLWQIMNSQTSFPIAPSVVSTALYSSLLLIVGGLISFKLVKLGVLLGTAALVLFGTESYSTFGSFPSAIPVSILPGLGPFLAACGIILGVAALRTAETPIARLLSRLKTPLGLGETGIVVTSISLSADGWTHWSAGQLSGFLGSTFVEGILHRVFFLGTIVLLIIFLIQRNVFLLRNGAGVVVTMFVVLVLDGFYHFATGNIADFVGHDATEFLLHVLTYYGAVSLVVARFFVKR